MFANDLTVDEWFSLEQWLDEHPWFQWDTGLREHYCAPFDRQLEMVPTGTSPAWDVWFAALEN